MAMSQTGGNASKATFLGLDKGNAELFTVQYNPKEFRVEKSLTWEEAKTQGQSNNAIQFQKGAPMTASFDLIFDTTVTEGAKADSSGTPSNVQKVWVDKLLSLTNADTEPSQGEPKELKKKRPPALLFQWGTFKMKCVIESVSVTYLMFAASGEAVRARCSVKLKEWQTETFQGEGSFKGADSKKVKLVEVKGGQTVSQVASSNGSDMRTVAAANGITDPMSDMTGQVISVPSGSSSSSSNSSTGSSLLDSLINTAASTAKNAATSAASSAASAAISAATSGNISGAASAALGAASSSVKSSANSAKSSATSAVTGAASKAAQDALKKIF
jgi:hypothetical protein